MVKLFLPGFVLETAMSRPPVRHHQHSPNELFMSVPGAVPFPFPSYSHSYSSTVRDVSVDTRRRNRLDVLSRSLVVF